MYQGMYCRSLCILVPSIVKTNVPQNSQLLMIQKITKKERLRECFCPIAVDKKVSSQKSNKGNKQKTFTNQVAGGL